MAKVKDSMIRSTAGSNTEKWAGKRYKSKKVAKRKVVGKRKAVGKRKGVAIRGTNPKVKAVEQKKRKNRYAGTKRVTPMKKKSSY
tara:strand:- start:737 stop:991 length:255 start_codon:yes stop_codon:yes gene_type:complete